MGRKKKEENLLVPETVVPVRHVVHVDYSMHKVPDYDKQFYYREPKEGDEGWMVQRYKRYDDDLATTAEIARFRSREHAEWFLNKVRGGC